MVDEDVLSRGIESSGRTGFEYTITTFINMTFDLEFLYEFLWNVIDCSDIDDNCCGVLFEFETILGEYDCIIKQPTFRP